MGLYGHDSWQAKCSDEASADLTASGGSTVAEGFWLRNVCKLPWFYTERSANDFELVAQVGASAFQMRRMTLFLVGLVWISNIMLVVPSIKDWHGPLLCEVARRWIQYFSCRVCRFWTFSTDLLQDDSASPGAKVFFGFKHCLSRNQLVLGYPFFKSVTPQISKIYCRQLVGLRGFGQICWFGRLVWSLRMQLLRSEVVENHLSLLCLCYFDYVTFIWQLALIILDSYTKWLY